MNNDDDLDIDIVVDNDEDDGEDDEGLDIDEMESLDPNSEWISLGRMVQLEDSPICALSIDPFDEMVWLGHANVCIWLCTCC